MVNESRDNMIIIQKVKKNYYLENEIVESLKEINFNIGDGEFVAILGPSGSGKSTLLNVISGLDTVTEGEIIVDGEIITRMSDRELTEFRRRKLGFVFQSYNLITSLTVFENIAIGKNLSNNPLSIDELLLKVNLSTKKTKFPFQLSGGEQQRVSIARALAKKPRLLFCDEPTGALDEVSTKQVLELLANVNKEYKTTIVVVTHNAAIKNYVDRIVYMKSGLIEAIESKLDK